jgi:hypothetical protein
MQRRQAGDWQACRLPVRHAVGDDRERIEWCVDAFGPRTDRQHPDNARSDIWSPGHSAGLLHDAGEIPARRGSGFHDCKCPLDLAAVERNRGDTDGDLAGFRQRETDFANSKSIIIGLIDSDGADLIGRHRSFPSIRTVTELSGSSATRLQGNAARDSRGQASTVKHASPGPGR